MRERRGKVPPICVDRNGHRYRNFGVMPQMLLLFMLERRMSKSASVFVLRVMRWIQEMVRVASMGPDAYRRIGICLCDGCCIGC